MRRDKEALNSLDQDIQDHIENEIQENIECGMSLEEARRQAMVKFGNVVLAKEDTRAVWVWIWLEQLFQDVRYALRTISRKPGFALMVILTLGLGIGANTAVFSLMDQVLLRVLPVENPRELVLLDGPGPFQGYTRIKQGFSMPMFRELQKASAPVMSRMFARYETSATINIAKDTERVTAELVSGDYFHALGVGAALGRTLSPEDDRIPSAHPVIVLSYDFWQRRFGGDAAVIDQDVRVNGYPMTVIGVAAPGFNGVDMGQPADFFASLMMKKELIPTWDDLDTWRSRWVNIMGRLKPNASQEQAAAVLNTSYRQFLVEDLKTVRSSDATDSFREQFLAKKLFLHPGDRGRSTLRSQFSTPLIVLMGMVGLVLLIACANVANLLLARVATQQKEVVIRLALGAGQFRLMQQRLVESLVLWAGGALIGLLFAWWTTSLLVEILPFDRAARALSSYPDLRVILFAITITAVTAIIFGLVPMLYARKPLIAGVLKAQTGRMSGGAKQARFRKVLVIAQVALSLVLLAGAGLFARSLYNLRAFKPGFITNNLLQFFIDPSLSGYTRERSIALFRMLQDQLKTLPGVTATSLAAVPAMNDSKRTRTVTVVGYAPNDDENMSPNINAVGPGYFDAMGIPLVMGREFRISDNERAPRVAIVNETMARYFWRGRDPIGQRFGWANSTTAADIEVIGVVKDSKFSNIRDEIPRFLYIPYMQEDILNRMTFYIRYQPKSLDLSLPARQVVQRLDPNLPIFNMKTMQTQVDEALFRERLVAILSILFGALATILAGIGLYGVMSYMVSSRTTEIGIRMALGAERLSVLWIVLREVVVLVVAGMLPGLVVAIALSRLVQSQLFALSPTDPVTLIIAAIMLSAVAMFAGYLPAQRATRLDPMLALRNE